MMERETHFPGSTLFRHERNGVPNRPRECFAAIVGRIEDDRVVLDAKLFDLAEYPTHIVVMVHPAIRIKADTGLALPFLAEMRPDVQTPAFPG